MNLTGCSVLLFLLFLYHNAGYSQAPELITLKGAGHNDTEKNLEYLDMLRTVL
jgi:hypothetical protein